jgi:RNA polymerase sigma-70 factor (ECF subfamily)
MALGNSGDWLAGAYDEHHRSLHAHCYRLAGNVTDADDLVQETYLRAWKARDAFAGRASTRTWLYRIATNVFLDGRKSAARRVIPSGDILESSTEIGPYPDALLDDDPQQTQAAGEMVELALIVALMHLPPRQRVAFVLRDVSGWTPAETAEALEVAVPAANSLVQRARETVRRHAPSDPREWSRPRLTAQDKDILRRYMATTDPRELVELLAEDVRLTMPPDPAVLGRDAAVEFFLRPNNWRSLPASANGRPAALNYLRRPGGERYEALVVDVLRIVDAKIVECNAFVGAHHVTAFGVPPTLEPVTAR